MAGRTRCYRSIQSTGPCAPIIEPLEERRLLSETATLLKDINPTSSSSPRAMVEVNNTFFFNADDGSGYELWKTDGTPEGTAMVKDICPVKAQYGPSEFTEVNGILYFAMEDSAAKSQSLWRSDGTALGTWKVKDFGDVTRLRWFTNFGGSLVFGRYTWSDDQSWTELWKTDGTPEGTCVITDADSSNPYTVSGDLLYFFNFVGETYGYEALWRTDSTPNGSILIKSRVGREFTTAAPSIPRMVDLNGTLFFSSFNGLWQTDGSVAGTVKLATLDSPVFAMVALGDSVYLFAFTGVCKYSSSAGLEQISPVMASLNGVFNDRIYFTASADSSYELWSSDGTTQGTAPLRDISTGSELPLGPGAAFQAVGDFVFFGAKRSGDTTRRLWMTDGTNRNTVLVCDLADPVPLYATSNKLFFTAIGEDGSGTELYFIDAPSPPAWVSGLVYQDDNGSSSYNSGELPCAGRTVVVDLDEDGELDNGEPLAVTDADGHYTLRIANAGQYVIRFLDAPDWHTSFPSAGHHAVTVASDQRITRNFGMRRDVTASTGGPYTLIEGGSITLAATAALLPGRTAALFEWDYNYDGVSFDADDTDSNSTFSAASLDGPSTRNIALRVTDSSGSVSQIVTTTVRITNLRPAAVFSAKAAVINRGSNGLVRFTSPTEAPADLPGLRYSYDFDNDGRYEVLDSTTRYATVPTSYLPFGGTYTMRGRVRDDDGAQRSYKTEIAVVNRVGTSTTIQAEDFDFGVEGVAYHDSGPANAGKAYRSTGVDIWACTDTYGGYQVKSITRGEWLRYSLDVLHAGTYKLAFRVACRGLGGKFHVELDGKTLPAIWTIPDTGSWSSWRTIGQTVNIPAGRHSLRVVFDSYGTGGYIGAVNYVSFKLMAPVQPLAMSFNMTSAIALPRHSDLLDDSDSLFTASGELLT